jgi:hypothetical protein
MTRNLRPMRVRVTRPIRCRCGGWAADSWGACRRCGLPFPEDLPRAAAYEEE